MQNKRIFSHVPIGIHNGIKIWLNIATMYLLPKLACFSFDFIQTILIYLPSAKVGSKTKNVFILTNRRTMKNFILKNSQFNFNFTESAEKLLLVKLDKIFRLLYYLDLKFNESMKY